MQANYFIDPVIFLTDSVLSLYILAVLLRFLLQWSSADFYNPISQFVIKITHPPLRLLRRFVPPVGKIDTSSLLLIVILQLIDDFVILLLKGIMVSVGALSVLAFSQLVSLLLNVLVFAIIARALLSWFNPGTFYALEGVLSSLTEPLLKICRSVIPYMGGIDLSPMAALLLLQLAKMMILPPLNALANLIG